MNVPERIGKYAISAVLGRGAMGVVYKGFDPHIQRTVAIKTIHKELLGGGDADSALDSIAARFRNEAQAVGRLQHPGIVAIYEYGEDADTAYIAMEYVEGRSLDRVLAAGLALAETQVRHILDELLDALDCAHRHGVWHRDIKPANLIQTASGQVKLTDFGIARIESAGLTQVASTIGTPGYMAPEQYLGEGIDQRADLFASGVLLYQLLAGVQPFTGTPEAVMYQIMNQQPCPPSHVRSAAWLADYDSVVMKALSKEPEQRFQSAQAFRAALQAVPMNADAALADDATVIVPPARRAAGAGADSSATLDRQALQGMPVSPSAGTPMAASGAQAGATGVPPTGLHATGWDPLVLGRVERALASSVGPMARLMVRQAAHQCADVASLTMELAQHIDTEPQRQKFIGAAMAGTQATPLPAATARTGAPDTLGAASRATATAGTSSGTPADPPLSEADRAHALAVLSRHLGPIARIVVKRAADQATNNAQLIQLLIDSAGDLDKAALLKDLTVRR